MKSIGFLETGGPPAALQPRFGAYPAMFERLLGPAYAYATYDVAAGAFPERPQACHAYVVTGSPAGVYDDLPWIDPLKRFLVEAKGKAVLVGVCFGHQAMAEAFGGRVEKSARGWGVGLHSYPIVRHEAWMDSAPLVAAPASHQDQVVTAPPDAELIVSSLFTPYAGFAWRDGTAISFQFHPEMSVEFARALYETRREIIPDADAAIASLDQPNDCDRVGEWIRRFLTAPQPL